MSIAEQLSNGLRYLGQLECETTMPGGRSVLECYGHSQAVFGIVSYDTISSSWLEILHHCGCWVYALGDLRGLIAEV